MNWQVYRRRQGGEKSTGTVLESLSARKVQKENLQVLAVDGTWRKSEVGIKDNFHVASLGEQENNGDIHRTKQVSSKSRWGWGNDEFQFGYVESEMPLSHMRKDGQPADIKTVPVNKYHETKMTNVEEYTQHTWRTKVNN